jgi:TolA-binding protein
MTDKCKQFDSFLIDLAYGELPDSHAEELRTHAAQCATCREALDEIMIVRKMAKQLPPLEPASSLDALVLSAAAEAADQYAEQQGSHLIPKTAGPKLAGAPIDKGPTFQERLRAFLLSPALATAAVVGLVFVISFFLVQKGPLREEQVSKESPVAFETPIPESDRMVLQNADKSEMRATQEGKKSLAKESLRLEPSASKAEQQPAVPVRKAPPSALKRGKAVPAEPERRSARASGSGAGYLGSAAPVLDTEKRKKTTSTASVDSAGRKQDEKQLRGMVDDASDFALAEAEEEAVFDSYPRAQAAAAPTKSRLPDTAASDFRMGKEAYARSDCMTAKAAFQRVVDQPATPSSKAAIAMHHIGACEKRQGRCAKAVEWYEKLLKSYPNYPHKADALWQAAGCYRRLGQRSQSRALLEQLTRISGWETKARQELEQLDK